MSDIEQDKQLSYADKIAKLLNLAESTDNANEADAFNARAQSLMIRYGISERLLAQARGHQLQEEIIEHTITYKGIFHMALWRIGSAIARENNCTVWYAPHRGTARTDLHVIGYEPDVTNVKLLDASLQIQASTAMQRWYRGQDVSWHTPMEKAKMRRTFLFGFANGLTTKLAAAKKTGVDAVVQEETERTGDAAAARISTDLVLMSKKKKVDEWMDARYGATLRTVKNRYTTSAWSDRAAGHRAGMNASVNQTGIGGSGREIGS
jgi:hypothetical protein